MFILLLLFSVSTCTANSEAVAGNNKFTFQNIIEDLYSGGNKTGLNLDQMCLRGYVKAVYSDTTQPHLKLHKPNPMSLTLTLCTPQEPICMSRRDTVKLKGSPNTTQYFRFGCREAKYWITCDIEPNPRTAVFCGTSIRQQLWKKGSTLPEDMNTLMIPLTNNHELMKKEIRYVSMSEKKRRDLYSDYGDIHDHVETGERSYNKLYALLTILLLVGGYKTYTVFMKLLHYKKRNTQVDMDAPDLYDTEEEDRHTSNSSSTDSKIKH